MKGPVKPLCCQEVVADPHLDSQSRPRRAVLGGRSPTPLSMNPEEPMLEYDTSSHPFRQDLIGGAVCMSDGKVRVPQNPGIGVEVDRDTLERYGRRGS